MSANGPAYVGFRTERGFDPIEGGPLLRPKGTTNQVIEWASTLMFDAAKRPRTEAALLTFKRLGQQGFERQGGDLLALLIRYDEGFGNRVLARPDRVGEKFTGALLCFAEGR